MDCTARQRRFLGAELPGGEYAAEPRTSRSRLAGLGNEGMAPADVDGNAMATSRADRGSVASDGQDPAPTSGRNPGKHDALVGRNAKGSFRPDGRLLCEDTLSVRGRYESLDQAAAELRGGVFV